MRAALVAALVAAFAIALPGAHAGSKADPGVTGNSILLGGTVPLTGPAAAFASVAPGADAYFRYVNDRGGVFGRKIRYKYVDDGFEITRTVDQTRRLVQQDRVFAIFNSIGTEHAIAVRPYLNQVRVPQVFTGTGATTFQAERAKYPWSMGYLPSFAGEGAIYGRYLAATLPNARIAVLYENTDYGRDLTTGLRRGLGRRGNRIVAVRSYEITDADVNSQIAQLKRSGANTFMLFATPGFAIQSFLGAHRQGWHPRTFISSVSIEPSIMKVIRLNTNARATAGTISMGYLKDPTSPTWNRDPAVRLYRQIMRRYLPGRKASDVYHYYGMAVANSMVHALRKAGRNLTRSGLQRAVTHLNQTDNPFLLPGVAVRTSPRNYFPIARAKLFRYSAKGQWVPFGRLLAAR
ncbi:MAG TPA: ABC transporter substrate-binding protein [Gaiellaceae bacterium]|jgi:ABC-type branched-subunit amino acid transport system substrate-binding protein